MSKKNPNSRCRRKLKRDWKSGYGKEGSPFDSWKEERGFWIDRYATGGNPRSRYYYNKIQ